MSRAMRARSSWRSCWALDCIVTWAIRRRQIRTTIPHTLSSVIWNQPVCQKCRKIGCSGGTLSILSGVRHQGWVPTGPTTVALGQHGGACFMVCQCRSVSGTTRQLLSERTSLMLPSANSMRRPRITPAAFAPTETASALWNASTPSLCVPRLSTHVKSYSVSILQSLPLPTCRPSRNRVYSLSTVIRSSARTTGAEFVIWNDFQNRHVCLGCVSASQIQTPRPLVESGLALGEAGAGAESPGSSAMPCVGPPSIAARHRTNSTLAPTAQKVAIAHEVPAHWQCTAGSGREFRWRRKRNCRFSRIAVMNRRRAPPISSARIAVLAVYPPSLVLQAIPATSVPLRKQSVAFTGRRTTKSAPGIHGNEGLRGTLARDRSEEHHV